MAICDNRTVMLALRAAQAILAIIILGLTGYVAHEWTSWWHAASPSQDNFLLFCALWTLLVVAFLVVVPMAFAHSKANHHYAILGVEAVTCIFWFAGFIALAVFITGVRCDGGMCSAAQAATVFGAFEWLLFTATTTFAAMHSMRSRQSPTSKADLHISAPEPVEVV